MFFNAVLKPRPALTPPLLSHSLLALSLNGNSKTHYRSSLAKLLKPTALLGLTIFLASPASAATERCYTNDWHGDYSEYLGQYIEAMTGTTLDINDHLDPGFHLQAVDTYYRLLSPSGTVLYDQLYDIETFEDYTRAVILAKKDGYLGAIDSQGQLLFDFNYDAIELLNDQRYLLSKVINSTLSDALVSESGQWLYPASGEFKSGLRIQGVFYDQDKDKGYFKITYNGKSGLIDDSGQLLVPMVYDNLEIIEDCGVTPFSMIVHLGNKSGIINQHDEVIVPLREKQFITGFHYSDSVVSVQNANRYGTDYLRWWHDNDSVEQHTLMTPNGQIILTSDSALKALKGNLYTFTADGKVGIVNDLGQIVLEAKYDDVFFEDKVNHREAPLLAKRGNKIAIIGLNSKSGTAERPSYSSGTLVIDQFYDALQMISSDNNTSYAFDANGANNTDIAAIVVDEKIESNSESNIAEKAEVFINYPYDYKLYIASQAGKYGLVDSDDNVIIPFDYDDMTEMGELLIVQNKGKYGVLDSEGQMLTPLIYDGIYDFENYDTVEWLVLAKDNREAIMSPQGEMLMPLSNFRVAVDRQMEFDDRPLIPIKRNGKFGLLNQQMTAIAIEPEFEKIAPLYGHTNVLVQKDGKRQLRSMAGEHIYKPSSTYNIVSMIQVMGANGLIIEDAGKQGVIDLDGKALIPLDYDTLQQVESIKDMDSFEGRDEDYITRYIFEKKGLFGLLDENGETILAPTYSHMRPLAREPYFVIALPNQVSSDNPNKHTAKYGLIDNNGKLVIAAKYDAIDPEFNNDNIVARLVNTAAGIVELYDNNLQLVKTTSLNEDGELANHLETNNTHLGLPAGEQLY